MPLRISFELSDDDLQHFQQVMRRAKTAANDTDQRSVTDGAGKLLTQVQESTGKVPDFICERLEKLQVMIDMVHDEAWNLPAPERRRVLAALTYFADPEDMIPDHVPGLGFLDDAIMVELVVREMRHEIDAYGDFCRYREAEKVRAERRGESIDRSSFLADKRKQLQSRMRRRRRRDFTGTGTGAGRRGSPFSLW